MSSVDSNRVIWWSKKNARSKDTRIWEYDELKTRKSGGRREFIVLWEFSCLFFILPTYEKVEGRKEKEKKEEEGNCDYRSGRGSGLIRCTILGVRVCNVWVRNR